MGSRHSSQRHKWWVVIEPPCLRIALKTTNNHCSEQLNSASRLPARMVVLPDFTPRVNQYLPHDSHIFGFWLDLNIVPTLICLRILLSFTSRSLIAGITANTTKLWSWTALKCRGLVTVITQLWHISSRLLPTFITHIRRDSAKNFTVFICLYLLLS